MSPRDARTPRELYGDAVDDARALRRAYARLVRVHGPEDDPETFAHVRRLYEQALAELEGRAEAVAPDPTPASPPSADTTVDITVDTLLAEATAENLPQVLTTLRARVAETGEAEALDAAIGIQRALDPAGLPEVYAQAAHHAALQDRMLGQVGGLLAMMPPLAAHPGLDALFEQLATPERRLALVRMRVYALLVRGRAEEALALYRRVEPDLRVLPAEAWAPLFQMVIGGCAWRLDAHELEVARRQLGEAALPLEDAVYEDLEQLLLHVQEARRAASDPQVPDDLRRLPDRMHHQPPSVQLGLLWRLADQVPDLPTALDHLAEHWPGLHAACWQTMHRLASVERYLAAWHRLKVPPTQYTAAVVEPLRQAAALEDDLLDVLQSTKARARRTRNGVVAAAIVTTVVLVVLGLSEALGHGDLLGPLMLSGAGVLVAGELLLARPIDRRAAALQLRLDALSQDTIEPIDAHVRHTGLWPHELAAAASQAGLGALASTFDALVDDPRRLVALAGDEHIRRLAWAEREAARREALERESAGQEAS